MPENTENVLVVRRSIHIKAAPAKVWEQFESFERMERWWGVIIGKPEAGKANGQRLVTYQPRTGGRIEMEVMFGGDPLLYGGEVITFEPGRELTFESTGFPTRVGCSLRS